MISRLTLILIPVLIFMVFSCTISETKEEQATTSSENPPEAFKPPKLSDTLEENGYKFYIQPLTEKQYTSLESQPYLDEVPMVKVSCPDKDGYCPLKVEKFHRRQLKDSMMVLREGHDLKLRLLDSSYVTLTSSGVNDSDDYVGYYFQKYIEDLGLYLVSVHYYEEGEVLIINAHNGEKTTVDGNPIVSPDRKRLISIAQIVGLGEPVAVSIYEIKDHSLKNIFSYTKDWGAIEAGWLDNNSLKLIQEAMYQKKDGSYDLEKSYCKLTILE